jgi:hypothetical protein
MIPKTVNVTYLVAVAWIIPKPPLPKVSITSDKRAKAISAMIPALARIIPAP